MLSLTRSQLRRQRDALLVDVEACEEERNRALAERDEARAELADLRSTSVPRQVRVLDHPTRFAFLGSHVAASVTEVYPLAVRPDEGRCLATHLFDSSSVFRCTRDPHGPDTPHVAHNVSRHGVFGEAIAWWPAA